MLKEFYGASLNLLQEKKAPNRYKETHKIQFVSVYRLRFLYKRQPMLLVINIVNCLTKVTFMGSKFIEDKQSFKS